MGLTNPTMPTTNDPRGPEELDMANAVAALLAEFNGNVDNANLKPAADIAWSKLHNGALLLQQAGSSADGVVRRGKSIVATQESRTNAAYGTLPTPDQVSGLVLPTDGLIVVGYQAMWKESVNGAARVAIFLGANQLKWAQKGVASPGVSEAGVASTPNTFTPLSSNPVGLDGTGSGVAYTGDVTTGQVLGYGGGGGVCYIFAAAGTYDVSVQFKASSGSVTAQNRKLWVWTVGF